MFEIILTIVKIAIIILGCMTGIAYSIVDGSPFWLISAIKEIFVESEYFLERLLMIIFGVAMVPIVIVAEAVYIIIIILKIIVNLFRKE